jgi:hypothetical protein
MTGRSVFVAATVLVVGAACTGGLGEVPTVPEPAAEAPTAPAPPDKPGKAHKGGKGAKGGKRPDAAGCPEGVVAAPSWPGEYPGPVVDVVKAVSVQVRAEPCSRPSFDCSVPAGLYHPWSEVPSDYVTVRSITKWKLTKDVDVDELHAKTGDIVEVYQVFGEGYCGYVVAGKEVTAPCPELLGESLTRVEGGRDIPDKQMFSVTCGGRTGWVEENDALFALPEVREGTIPEYGTVGPGKD